jgi:hypothetical protein
MNYFVDVENAAFPWSKVVGNGEWEGQQKRPVGRAAVWK